MINEQVFIQVSVSIEVIKTYGRIVENSQYLFILNIHWFSRSFQAKSGLQLPSPFEEKKRDINEIQRAANKPEKEKKAEKPIESAPQTAQLAKL